ncbi:2-dehydropantoate 2-reductase [Exophiala viscosa]|uniref:2-dehydropantoate 2-reductase n=1 Tax=Exophiala viscosa TaxID=2486360 RepID=A0AAN6E2J0_9EURO|nr:2-dehydropantoate 2-reductase [Exophiala viscosa]
MYNVLIFGTGSIGGVYACILSNASANVTCVCRSNYEEARKNGFAVTSSVFGRLHARPVIVRSVQEATQSCSDGFHFIVLCTKATKETTSITLEALEHAVNSRSKFPTLVIIQNGLGVEESFHIAFPSTVIISGVAYLPTTQTSPAVFSHSETEHLHLGLYPSQCPSVSSQTHLHDFARLVRAGNATVTVHDDIQRERWKKIVANGALNPVCALTRCRDRELIDLVDVAGAMIMDVMQEIASVASSQGYEDVVTQAVVEAQYARCLARPYPGVEPSMMADARLSRPMEVYAIVGEMVSIARQARIDTPRLKMLYVLITGLNHALQTGREGTSQV